MSNAKELQCTPTPNRVKLGIPTTGGQDMHPYGQLFMVLRCIILVYGIVTALKFSVLLYRATMYAIN